MTIVRNLAVCALFASVTLLNGIRCIKLWDIEPGRMSGKKMDQFGSTKHLKELVNSTGISRVYYDKTPEHVVVSYDRKKNHEFIPMNQDFIELHECFLKTNIEKNGFLVCKYGGKSMPFTQAVQSYLLNKMLHLEKEMAEAYGSWLIPNSKPESSPDVRLALIAKELADAQMDWNEIRALDNCVPLVVGAVGDCPENHNILLMSYPKSTIISLSPDLYYNLHKEIK
jgi:hypothetical protein